MSHFQHSGLLDATNISHHYDENEENEEEEEENHTFSCRMENIKLLIELLSSLSLDVHKDQDCLIDATEAGNHLLLLR